MRHRARTGSAEGKDSPVAAPPFHRWTGEPLRFNACKSIHPVLSSPRSKALKSCIWRNARLFRLLDGWECIHATVRHQNTRNTVVPASTRHCGTCLLPQFVGGCCLRLCCQCCCRTDGACACVMRQTGCVKPNHSTSPLFEGGSLVFEGGPLQPHQKMENRAHECTHTTASGQ